MHKYKRIGLMTAIGVWATLPVFSNQVYVSINPTGNMQTSMQSTFPSGNVCDTSGFGPQVCFNIGASNVNNFELVSTQDTFNVNSFGVTHIYMLINANLAVNGQSFASIILSGTNSTSQSINLITGSDVRDYYQGNASLTINGTTTKNFYSVDNAQGHQCIGCGTLQTNNFRLDEIDIAISNAFLTETLNTLTVYTNNSGNWGTPIIAAITVEGTPPVVIEAVVPEPGSIAMALGGIALILIGRKRITR